MLTGRNFCVFFLLIFIITGSCSLCAQGSDTLKTTTKFQPFWTQQRFVPKIGAGVQDRAFLEIGVQWHNIFWHPLSLASKGPYTTIDLFIDRNNFIVGPKVGYEFTAGLLGAAFDVTYFIDTNYDGEKNTRRAFVGTPKVGLTILGFVDLYYGYQIPFSEQRITSLSPNRFSITFNLNKDYFHLKEARRRYGRVTE